jgi:hypothetical protein
MKFIIISSDLAVDLCFELTKFCQQHKVVGVPQPFSHATGKDSRYAVLVCYMD